jgi:hypothetical protein
MPELYALLPTECLKTGAYPDGWDPKEQVVPAFCPDDMDAEIVTDMLGDRAEGRVLVRYRHPERFEQRMTGPDKMYHGVWKCLTYIPPEDLELSDYTALGRTSTRTGDYPTGSQFTSEPIEAAA